MSTVAGEGEQQAIRSILQILRRRGDAWERRRSAAAQLAIGAARGKFSDIGEHELDTHILRKGKVGKFDENEFLVLPPPAKDDTAIAAIWCRWDFEKPRPKCGFYYGVWSVQPPFPLPEPHDGGKHVAFVGYRFETPEFHEGDTVGNHCFYHAQPCRSLGEKDNPIEQALPISHRTPTWPLAAENALELLLCLITSLYGMIGLGEIREEIQAEPKLRRDPLIREALGKVLGLNRITG